jgi:hypothetical protein
MSWLRTILDEAIGLFVDDGAFALAIVVLVALVGALALWATGIRPYCGPILFIGLVAILVESALRRARK